MKSMKSRISFSLTAVALIAIVSSAALPCLADTFDAKSIIDRPSRMAEEAAAWHPTLAPFEEALAPKQPLKDSYPTVSARIPVGWGAGFMFWMDNRYMITEIERVEGKEHKTRLVFVDTDTGEVLDYREGRLSCYRGGKITYSTGPSLSFSKRDVPGGAFWHGELGKERPFPVWDESGRKYRVNPFTCALEYQDALTEREKAIEGVFYPPPAKREMPKWKLIPLYPEHGDFANYLPDVWAMSELENDARTGFYWFRPSGERVPLNLSLKYEVWVRGTDDWHPWIGRYVFTGTGVHYSLAPSAAYSAFTPSAERYGELGNVVIFDPATGSITKVPRPKWFLRNVQVWRAFLTRAGMLWVSDAGRPWGIYLSRGEEVRLVSPVKAAGNAPARLSPDGCRAAVRHDANPNRPDGLSWKLQIIDFCGR